MKIFFFHLYVSHACWTNSSCRQQAADAINVDNISDYQEIMVKITETKLSVVKIFIDMWHIQSFPGYRLAALETT